MKTTKKARAKAERIEGYCALSPAQRRLVLRVIAALSKIPTK